MAEYHVIETSPEIMHGTPVFAGTRVPVKTLFDCLKGGDTVAEFLDDFPTVNREQALAALEMAGEELIDAAVAGRIAAKEAQNASRIHDVRTVPEMGWTGKRNGELLRLAEQEFEVFVTPVRKYLPNRIWRRSILLTDSCRCP
jgi:uncharacterized protein (DUF433 family)